MNAKKKARGNRYTPPKPRALGWLKDAFHPSCKCDSGHCTFHNYPYTGSLVA